MASAPRLSEMPDLLRVPDVAAVLQVSERQVWELLRQGAIPRVQGIGRVVRVPKVWLAAKVEEVAA